ncbi:MAG: hypothetical protein GX767_03010, partial [Firmicutes bacterium]|nr:hypothetical protein [Bacillota bacterium]
MCVVTLYKDSIKEENKLVDNVSRYTLDLKTGKLTVYPMLSEPQEFKITKGISWDES